MTRGDRAIGAIAERHAALAFGPQPRRQCEGDFTTTRAGSHHNHLPTLWRGRLGERRFDLHRRHLDRLHHRRRRPFGNAVGSGRP